MRAVLVFACAITVSGCVDSYTPIPGGTASIANTRADTRDCRNKASDVYLYDQGHAAAALGFVGGGAMGGALGGAVAGGSLAAATDKPAQPTLSQMIEVCMAARGYAGTSRPY